MNSNLKFDFTVDRENKTITVKREFAANLDLVWEAWTNPEILDQWWKQKNHRTQTKSMDFKEGGFWLFAMISPENLMRWTRYDYQKIEVKKGFDKLHGFCDENGTINPDFPRAEWAVTFNEAMDTTTVNINIQYKSILHLEKTLEMGFQNGFSTSLGNLDEVLFTLQK